MCVHALCTSPCLHPFPLTPSNYHPLPNIVLWDHDDSVRHLWDRVDRVDAVFLQRSGSSAVLDPGSDHPRTAGEDVLRG